MRPLRLFLNIGAALVCLGSGLLVPRCDLFDFTPHDINIAAKKLNAQNYARMLREKQGADSTFTFALIADPHRAYDLLKKMVLHLNTQSDIDFVIVMGDVTKFGLVKEYKWLDVILSMLDMPYFVLLGNHDCQGNGKLVFQKLFGPFDYVFLYKNAKFVVANTNGWEFESGVPNEPFLDTALARPAGIDHLFFLSHIPIFGEQVSGADERMLRSRLNAAGVDLAVAGHKHTWYYATNHEDDRFEYLLIDNVGDLNFGVIRVEGAGYSITRRWIHD